MEKEFFTKCMDNFLEKCNQENKIGSLNEGEKTYAKFTFEHGADQEVSVTYPIDPAEINEPAMIKQRLASLWDHIKAAHFVENEAIRDIALTIAFF